MENSDRKVIFSLELVKIDRDVSCPWQVWVNGKEMGRRESKKDAVQFAITEAVLKLPHESF